MCLSTIRLSCVALAAFVPFLPGKAPAQESCPTPPTLQPRTVKPYPDGKMYGPFELTSDAACANRILLDDENVPLKTAEARCHLVATEVGECTEGTEPCAAKPFRVDVHEATGGVWELSVRGSQPAIRGVAYCFKPTVSSAHPELKSTDVAIPYPFPFFEGYKPVRLSYPLDTKLDPETGVTEAYARELCKSKSLVSMEPPVLFSPQGGFFGFSKDGLNKLSMAGKDSALGKHRGLSEITATHVRCTK